MGVIEKVLYTKKEAAQALSISVRTLECYIALKELPVRRLGKRVLIHRQTLEKFARRDHGEAWTALEGLKGPKPEGVPA